MSRILIVGPSWVGDTVLAQPLFMRLLQRQPQLRLDVLAPPWTAPLVRRMPEVGDVIDHPFRHGELKVFARRRLGIELKARRYAQAIVLPNSLKSALPPYFASIPVRTGYRGEMRVGILNDLRVLDPQRLPLMVERFAALAEKKGAPLPRPLPRPKLRVDHGNQRLLLDRLGLSERAPILVLCPGAEYGPAKRWPAHHFAALARAAVQAGASVWLIGSPNDMEFAQAISESAGPSQVHNLCGRTALDDAVDLIAMARAVVSNDSGLMHVAAALDRPLFAIYGSSSPGFTPPLSPTAAILSLNLPCSPCFERECPLGHLNCLNGLDPIGVWEQIRGRGVLDA
jgi:heptosyltransferase-2